MALADLELCYLSASEALERFRARTLSPVELLDAQIARTQAVNPKLNAITYDYFDRAREQAKKAEAKYGKTDGRLRALEGVPVAIKDFHAVKGEITTLGSKIFEDFRPDYTAPTVDRLLRAGAIMHMRSTSPEFAHSGATHSPLWGVTRNPWNLEYTPGGSSGGAGAVVAAGMATLADGTDGGGSIRIPASACGLFGYKPPFGRNPLDRDHPFETILHYGPIVRSVADAALMQNVMSGQHPEDHRSLPGRVRLPTGYEGIRGFKVALSMDLGYLQVDPEVEEKTRRAAAIFRELGCEVEEVELGWDYGALDICVTWWEGIFAGLVGQYLPRWQYEMDPFVVTLVERGLRLSAARLYQCYEARGRMWQQLQPILKSHDVLICPTNTVPAVKADHDNANPDFRINGVPVMAYGGWIATYGFNQVSQCPVMSVPTGFSASGVPIGMQIVGRPYDDLSVFRASAAFEAVTRPWQSKRPAIE
ncbi:MAG: amidase [Rhodospirillales bacterium]|nr:amidase [Rhodospirillales bacterium]